METPGIEEWSMTKFSVHNGNIAGRKVLLINTLERRVV